MQAVSSEGRASSPAVAWPWAAPEGLLPRNETSGCGASSGTLGSSSSSASVEDSDDSGIGSGHSSSDREHHPSAQRRLLTHGPGHAQLNYPVFGDCSSYSLLHRSSCSPDERGGLHSGSDDSGEECAHYSDAQHYSGVDDWLAGLSHVAEHPSPSRDAAVSACRNLGERDAQRGPAREMTRELSPGDETVSTPCSATSSRAGDTGVGMTTTTTTSAAAVFSDEPAPAVPSQQITCSTRGYSSSILAASLANRLASRTRDQGETPSPPLPPPSPSELSLSSSSPFTSTPSSRSSSLARLLSSSPCSAVSGEELAGCCCSSPLATPLVSALAEGPAIWSELPATPLATASAAPQWQASHTRTSGGSCVSATPDDRCVAATSEGRSVDFGLDHHGDLTADVTKVDPSNSVHDAGSSPESPVTPTNSFVEGDQTSNFHDCTYQSSSEAYPKHSLNHPDRNSMLSHAPNNGFCRDPADTRIESRTARTASSTTPQGETKTNGLSESEPGHCPSIQVNSRTRTSHQGEPCSRNLRNQQDERCPERLAEDRARGRECETSSKVSSRSSRKDSFLHELKTAAPETEPNLSLREKPETELIGAGASLSPDSTGYEMPGCRERDAGSSLCVDGATPTSQDSAALVGGSGRSKCDTEGSSTPSIGASSTPGNNASSTPGYEASSTPINNASSTSGNNASSTPGNNASSTPGIEALRLSSSAASSTPVNEASTTPGIEASTTPDVEASTTPGIEASTTPGIEASTTPGIEASSAPGIEASTTPDIEASTTPGIEASTTPGIEASTTPGSDAVEDKRRLPAPTSPPIVKAAEDEERAGDFLRVPRVSPSVRSQSDLDSEDDSEDDRCDPVSALGGSVSGAMYDPFPREAPPSSTSSSTSSSSPRHALKRAESQCRRHSTKRRGQISRLYTDNDEQWGKKFTSAYKGGRMSIPDPSDQRLNWTKPPLSVLIIRKHLDNSVLLPFRDLVIWLVEEKNMLVYVEQKVLDEGLLLDDKDFEMVQHKLKPFREDVDDLTDKVDFIICLGGDGTLLYVSSLFQGSVPPVMAFNMGSLGFLTPFQFSQDFKQEVSRVMQGSASLLLRYRLKCVVVKHEGGAPTTNLPHVKNIQKEHKLLKTHKLVLNEVVLDRGPSSYLSNLDLYIEGRKVTTVQGDGLIISTPTGSTAYAVSAGASMIHPSVPCILLTPICPHSLSFRPIVVPAGVEIKIMLNPNSRGTAMVSFDGRDRQEIDQGDSLRITTAAYPVPSICGGDQIEDWFDGLAVCLNWNIRAQQRPLQQRTPSLTSIDSMDSSNGASSHYLHSSASNGYLPTDRVNNSSSSSTAIGKGAEDKGQPGVSAKSTSVGEVSGVGGEDKNHNNRAGRGASAGTKRGAGKADGKADGGGGHSRKPSSH